MQELSGWCQLPRVRCAVFRPERRSSIRSILGDGARSSYIARGLGRSCCDAALNADAGVIDMGCLNRFLRFDAGTGELECEGGVSLGEILDVFLPRGFTLGVIPGTRYVTVGGAIAADVHGRNHHKAGSFSQYVQAFSLLTATGEVLNCSETSESDAFWATIGGMGLTGVILTARLRLLPIETSYLMVDAEPTPHLDDTLAALKRREARSPYVEARLNVSSSGAETGQALVMSGRHALRSELPERLKVRPLLPLEPSRQNIALFLSAFIPAGLDAVYPKGTDGRLLDYRTFFHPWDNAGDGARGAAKTRMVRYQMAFPEETSTAAIREVLERIVLNGPRPLHALLKSCGPENAAPLSFPTKGHTLSLIFKSAHDEAIGQFKELDLLVIKHRGRLYLAWDGALHAASLERMYPRLDEFRAVLKRIDPRGLLSSNMSRRLGIKASAIRTAIGGGTP